MTHKTILNPGAKQRLLAQLDRLSEFVEKDADRDTIQFATAELMPVVSNQFAYIEIPSPDIRVPRRYRRHPKAL